MKELKNKENVCYWSECNMFVSLFGDDSESVSLKYEFSEI